MAGADLPHKVKQIIRFFVNFAGLMQDDNRLNNYERTA